MTQHRHDGRCGRAGDHGRIRALSSPAARGPAHDARRGLAPSSAAVQSAPMDTASAAAAIMLPLLAGPTVEFFGLSALRMLGAGLMVPPLVLVVTRMK